MRKEEFKRCCQAAVEGEEITVENISTHEMGTVLFCSKDEIDVKVGENRKSWPASIVEEISSTSEIPHENE